MKEVSLSTRRFLVVLVATFILGICLAWLVFQRGNPQEQTPVHYVTAPDGTQIRQPIVPPNLPAQGDPRTQSVGPSYPPPGNN